MGTTQKRSFAYLRIKPSLDGSLFLSAKVGFAYFSFETGSSSEYSIDSYLPELPEDNGWFRLNFVDCRENGRTFATGYVGRFLGFNATR